MGLLYKKRKVKEVDIETDGFFKITTIGLLPVIETTTIDGMKVYDFRKDSIKLINQSYEEFMESFKKPATVFVNKRTGAIFLYERQTPKGTRGKLSGFI